MALAGLATGAGAAEALPSAIREWREGPLRRLAMGTNILSQGVRSPLAYQAISDALGSPASPFPGSTGAAPPSPEAASGEAGPSPESQAALGRMLVPGGVQTAWSPDPNQQVPGGAPLGGIQDQQVAQRLLQEAAGHHQGVVHNKMILDAIERDAGIGPMDDRAARESKLRQYQLSNPTQGGVDIQSYFNLQRSANALIQRNQEIIDHLVGLGYPEAYVKGMIESGGRSRPGLYRYRPSMR